MGSFLCLAGSPGQRQAEAEFLGPGLGDSGRAGAAGADRAAGRGGLVEHGDRDPGAWSRPTKLHWRDRYAHDGLGALQDRRRSGRPRRMDAAEGGGGDVDSAARAARGDPLVKRLLAAELGVGFATVALRIWRDWDLQPWPVGWRRRSSSPPTRSSTPRSVMSSGCTCTRRRTPWWSVSTRNPRCQALERTAPILPMRPGMPETADPRLRPQRHHHACSPPWRSPPARSPTPACPGTATRSSCGSSSRSATAYPRRGAARGVRQLRHPQARRGPRSGWPRNPRITLHFTPTGCSWMNLVECFFGHTRQAIRRGSLTQSASSSTPSAGSSTTGTTTADRSPGPRSWAPSWMRTTTTNW